MLKPQKNTWELHIIKSKKNSVIHDFIIFFRYLQPGDPHYDSPLFLDCCGLVRQTILDLKDDFGFSLGPWNQAYQYDTLPNDISFEEMRPGDLIFYSGRYHDRKRRRHAHDMVHVEIFLGGESGCQTIAARRREGVVQIFDDYRFKSTIYYNVVIIIIILFY